MNDKELTDALNQWQCPVDDTPRFQSAVWQRIATAESQSVSWWGRILPEIWQPRGLVTAFLLTALVSVAGATTTATLYNQKHTAALRWQYVQTIDPYLHLASTP